jgi:hypothetical protein
MGRWRRIIIAIEVLADYQYFVFIHDKMVPLEMFRKICGPVHCLRGPRIVDKGKQQKGVARAGPRRCQQEYTAAHLSSRNGHAVNDIH